MKYIILFIIFPMFTTLSESKAQQQHAALKWNTLAPIPDKIGFAGSFAGVSGGALIVAGGANFPDGGAPWTGSIKAWTNEIFILENQHETWKKAGMLPKKMGYGVSVTYKNSLILIGGSNESGHLQDVWQLDYQNGKVKFTALPPLPQPIANSCGVLAGNIIYIMGGITAPDSKEAAHHFWSLDLSARKKEWKMLDTWPGAGRMLSVAGTYAGKVYLFSGVELINGQRKYLTDAFEYTPLKGWKKIADLPSSVAAAPTPAFANGEQLLIFGGDDGLAAPQASALKEKHPGFSDQIVSYDPKLSIWRKSGKIRTVKREDAAVHPNQSIWAPVTTTLTIWQGKVILPGGEVRPATRTPNVLIAEPGRN